MSPDDSTALAKDHIVDFGPGDTIDLSALDLGGVSVSASGSDWLVTAGAFEILVSGLEPDPGVIIV